MTAQRPSPAGRTRACPHCKATILESASVCPACRHYLRFDASAQPTVSPSVPAFRIEGAIKNPEGARQWEYAVVVSIRNEAGAELKRQVVSVGALEPLETRSFAVSVEVFGATGLVAPGSSAEPAVPPAPGDTSGATAARPGVRGPVPRRR
jgi:hypothetical protein